MTTLKDEKAGTIRGVNGRFTNVIAWPNGRLANQKWTSEARAIKSYGKLCQLSVEIRFDDNCKNGHESFAITGEVIDTSKRGENRFVAGGCLHDDIREIFPELASLIKWHLVGTDGPMHYLSNTLYHAGNTDYNGCLKGEPRAFETRLKVGNSPITHKIPKALLNYITNLEDSRTEPKTFEPVEVPYNGSSDYKFDPKYTITGLPVAEWYKAPFDTLPEATQWCEVLTKHFNALDKCKKGFIKYVEIPISFGEGKERDFDAARNIAVWPEATNKQLSLPKDKLKMLLERRLPALMAVFKIDMENCGFIYPSKEAV